tara:strand:+ start:2134 stop:3009 length:876 start_codon:yes stop_codon:yes gene_type:complete
MMNYLFPLLFLILILEVSASAQEPETRTLVWSDGTRYVGGVVEGKRTGKGTIFWQDGTRFVGEFDNDKRNGPGTMIMPDGTIYSGIFSNDQLVEASETANIVSSNPPRKEKQLGPVPSIKTNGSLEDLPNANEITQEEGELPATVQKSEASDTIILIPERQMPKISDDPYAPVTILTARIQSEVQEMISLWGAAWSEQNVPQYLSNYSADFVITDSISRREWEALRRNRLTSPRYIDIQIFYEEMELIAENTIDISFSQTYRSNLYRDSTKKVLRVRREEQTWRIIEEKTR